MKRIKLKIIVYTFLALLAMVLLTFILLFQRNIRTAASVRKLEDGLYSMEYKGDYNLDGFLEQGGASDDLAVAAPFAPMDGMNEKGLCVAVLMIQDSPGFQQDTGKPDLTTTMAVRLLLDKASDVEEALELLSQYDMHASAGMMVHFAIADAAGHSVVVEYIGNEMVVTETPVVTNYYLSPGEKYGIGTEESKIRYAMLQSGSTFSMDGIRDALNSVSKHNFDSDFASTEWSIVYNQSTREARYYHRENYEKYYSFMAGSP